jgi:hypothetical protein
VNEMTRCRSASETRALLHTLHSNRAHTEKRIVALGRRIHELNDELEAAQRQLREIYASIDYLEEE